MIRKWLHKAKVSIAAREVKRVDPTALRADKGERSGTSCLGQGVPGLQGRNAARRAGTWAKLDASWQLMRHLNTKVATVHGFYLQDNRRKGLWTNHFLQPGLAGEGLYPRVGPLVIAYHPQGGQTDEAAEEGCPIKKLSEA